MIRIPALDDAALIEAIASGDEQAIRELFRRHRDAMYKCALSVLHESHDAEDAVQTAMTKAIGAAPRDRPRRLRPWLLAITRNEALMLLRSRMPREALSCDIPSRTTVEDAFALREQVSGLVLDLRELPERQRAAIVLRHLYELSYRDIGELLGVRPATARQAVLQARHSLLARAQGRDQDCGDVRLLLSGDGRARRAVAVRAHLEACSACRAFTPAGVGARIRSLLPVPEPMLPPILLRLLSGPGTGLRTGGAAAACLCTVVIGLGLVERARRGGDGAPPVPGGGIARPFDREGRQLTTERSATARRAEHGTATGPAEQTRHPVPAPAGTARQSQPVAPARSAADRDPSVPIVGSEDERRPHVTVEVTDDTSVTVDGWDLEHLPIIGEPPVDPPVDPPVVPRDLLP